MSRICLLSLLGLLLFAGCSSGEDTYLELSSLSSKTYLIPASTYSCKSLRIDRTIEPDVSPNYFTLRNLSLDWRHAENTLTIALIRIRFNSILTKGEYDCNITGDDLLALKLNEDETWFWDGTLAPKTIATTDCDIKCGGIAVAGAGSATGTLEVIGYMTDPKGDETPVKARMNFNIESLD